MENAEFRLYHANIVLKVFSLTMTNYESFYNFFIFIVI